MTWPRFDIIDISQPVSSSTACFPGDVPFSREITINHQDSGILNLCAFTMSPHVGTHADAPSHIRGNMQSSPETAAALPLSPFVGPAVVVDVSPHTGPITWDMVESALSTWDSFPQRILFKTVRTIRYEHFENQYASFSPDLIHQLAQRQVSLIGIDTPSVDPVDSKTLDTHHALLQHNIHWLENLDLTQIPSSLSHSDTFLLIAAPLKFTELEASPVRALLLRPLS